MPSGPVETGFKAVFLSARLRAVFESVMGELPEGELREIPQSKVR